VAQRHSGSGFDNAGENDLAQGVELRLVPEKTGFPHGDFIQQGD
jgi:hypothetical protein